MWRILIIDYGIGIVMDYDQSRNNIWPRRMGVSMGRFDIDVSGKGFV
jgi:hypothetical protein